MPGYVFSVGHIELLLSGELSNAILASGQVIDACRSGHF
jgi:hypothetical protein